MILNVKSLGLIHFQIKADIFLLSLLRILESRPDICVAASHPKQTQSANPHWSEYKYLITFFFKITFICNRS